MLKKTETDSFLRMAFLSSSYSLNETDTFVSRLIYISATPNGFSLCGSELCDIRPDNGSCGFAQAVMDAGVTGQSRHTLLDTVFF